METSKSILPSESTEYPEILSRKATAELLGVNLSTLWAWTRAQKLRSYGLGNKVYYKYSEIINESLKPLN